MATCISGCWYCHVLVCRGQPGDPWRQIPRRGQLLLPEDAIACAKSPSGMHVSPADFLAVP